MKRIVYILTTLLVFVLSGVLLYIVSKPELTVSIDTDEHNPVLDTMMFSTKVVPPSGPEGRFYKSKINTGTTEILLTGPFIKSSSTTVSATFFDTKEVTIKPEKKSVEDIISEAIGGEKITIKDLRVFKSSNAIIANITKDNTIVSDSFPSLIVFNKDTQTWEDVSLKYIGDRSAFRLEPVVSNYFSELTSD